MADEASVPVTCSWCGQSAGDAPGSHPPLTWTVQTGPRGVEYLCDRCTRDNVRKIESSLPTDYW